MVSRSSHTDRWCPLTTSNGKVGVGTKGGLASAVRGLDHMVRVMRAQTDATLPKVIRMARLTPAERAGIADETGSLEAGKAADLLILSKELECERVFVGGVELERD